MCAQLWTLVFNYVAIKTRNQKKKNLISIETHFKMNNCLLSHLSSLECNVWIPLERRSGSGSICFHPPSPVCSMKAIGCLAQTRSSFCMELWDSDGRRRSRSWSWSWRLLPRSLGSRLGLKSEEKLVCYANICFGLAWHRQWKALELF